MVPNARIVIAHGQMPGDDIDSAFHLFKSGQADILLSTTIVENGIDIPNANTILIDQADKLGIADLYQLRGRVGRWNRRAFCYFLVQRMERLPEIARKRLEAMTHSSGHGGGMKVALRDLELRGAGDILGLDQSGHVSQIGFHLYCTLLKKTIKALRGELPKTYTECKVDIAVEARFPEDYINEVTLRMEFYRRLGEALTEKEVEEIFKEIIDRFGPLPKVANNLKVVSLIRIVGSLHKAIHIKLDNYRLTMDYKKGSAIEKKSWLFRNTSGKDLLLEAVLKELRNFFSNTNSYS
jgi:transcription-repair coupling factor (superfamily II helicase)